jgi:ATP-dependent Clp protease ATP-binding subunit ClpX
MPGLPPGSNPFNQSTGMTGGGTAKGEVVTIDTSSILFIFTGAFMGLDKIISDRIAKGSIGFNAHVRGSALDDLAYDENLATAHALNRSGGRKMNLLELAEPSDLISFGLIPEIVGRIPVTTAVEVLNEEMLVRVLTEPRNALLKQYEQLFRLSGVELRFTSSSLRELASSALAMGTGARGLRTVVERLLSDAMFEAPGIITAICLHIPLTFTSQAHQSSMCLLTNRWLKGSSLQYISRMDSNTNFTLCLLRRRKLG